MNSNAPEKIYIQPNAHDGWFEGKPNSDIFVEYVRKDAFIEKVINFLNYKLDDVVATRVPGTIIPHYIAKQELIEELKTI